MSFDLANKFLMTSMKGNYKYFPTDIVHCYHFNKFVRNNLSISKSRKECSTSNNQRYCIPICQQYFKNMRVPHNNRSLGIRKHKNRPILFNLYVDDFGVKYFHKQDVQNLINVLETRYTAKEDFKRI